MDAARRAIAESVSAAALGYVIAVTAEAALIHSLQPTEWELAWVSDVLLAVCLGVAVYLWRHLLTTRRELAAQERAQLVLQTQLSIAADIQRRLLPDVPAPTDGFQWAAALSSAGKIGGDFYDFVEHSPGLWVVLIADVSGKGIPAAMTLGSLRSAFRAFAAESADPPGIVTQLSTTMYREWAGSPYVTCVVFALDLQRRSLRYTNAGHPPGIVVGRRGTQYLMTGGPPAGLIPDIDFADETIGLSAGDRCVFVSDGVTEALDAEPGFKRQLINTCTDVSGSAADLCQAIMSRALLGRGPAGIDGWDDDRTVVVLSVRDF